MKPQNLFISMILCLSFFLFPFLASAASENPATNSAEAVDVYAVFWPIVPGRTVADSMFWVKQLKEGVGEFFTFGDINKSKYQITLAEKRLVETAKLFESKDYSNAFKSLNLNKENRDRAVELMKKAQEEQRKVGDLKARLVTSLENQQLVLKSIVNNIAEDKRAEIQNIIEELTLQISEAK